jgi:hypothetical protein
MKYRHGFVSNSSSTSFTIYGICLDPVEKTIYKNLQDDFKARCLIEAEKHGGSDPDLECFIKVMREELHVDCQWGQDQYSLYFGFEIDDMKDDETKLQFYDRVERLFKTAFKEVSCSWNSEAWYDS